MIQEEFHLSYPLIKIVFQSYTEELVLLKNLPYDSTYELDITMMSLGNNKPSESYIFNLVEVNRYVDFKIPEPLNNDSKEIQYNKLELQFLVKEHLDILNKKTTKLFKQKNIKDIIKYLQDERNIKINWNSEPFNKNIYQFLLNDQTLINGINSLNYYYGIYDDDFIFSLKLNDLKTQNFTKLSDVPNKLNIKKINFFSSIDKNDMNKILSQDEYFTLSKANINSENNTYFQTHYNNIKIKSKNNYEFYKESDFKINEMKNSSNYSSDLLKSHDSLLSRNMISSNGIFGNLFDDEYVDNVNPSIKNFYSKQIRNLNSTIIEIPHPFNFKDLELGNMVELFSENPQYQSILGYYIINKSMMILINNGESGYNDWYQTQKLHLIRSNYNI